MTLYDRDRLHAGNQPTVAPVRQTEVSWPAEMAAFAVIQPNPVRLLPAPSQPLADGTLRPSPAAAFDDSPYSYSLATRTPSSRSMQRAQSGRAIRIYRGCSAANAPTALRSPAGVNRLMLISEWRRHSPGNLRPSFATAGSCTPAAVSLLPTGPIPRHVVPVDRSRARPRRL